MPEKITMWTIFDRPDDFPESIVVRANDIFPGNPEPLPRKEYRLFADLDDARLFVKEQGADTCLGRALDDPPQIVETWM